MSLDTFPHNSNFPGPRSKEGEGVSEDFLPPFSPAPPWSLKVLSPRRQQVIEFESTALMIGHLGVRVSLIAYPVVSVKKVRSTTALPSPYPHSPRGCNAVAPLHFCG